LIAVSFASDPEHWKIAFDMVLGAIDNSFSARSITSGCDAWRKVW
jgi:hypothetical protein